MIMNPRRKHDRDRKIKERRKLLKSLHPTQSIGEEIDKLEDGYFENNNVMNQYATPGESKKTKTKNSYHYYRRKGKFGCKAKEYNHHDLIEVSRMDSAEAELNGTNIHKRVN